MKKHVKKLSINRETIVHLQGSDLRAIAGGMRTTVQCVEYSECVCETDGCGGGSSIPQSYGCPTVSCTYSC